MYLININLCLIYWDKHLYLHLLWVFFFHITRFCESQSVCRLKCGVFFCVGFKTDTDDCESLIKIVLNFDDCAVLLWKLPMWNGLTTFHSRRRLLSWHSYFIVDSRWYLSRGVTDIMMGAIYTERESSWPSPSSTELWVLHQISARWATWINREGIIVTKFILNRVLGQII